MARKCSVCEHQDVTEINSELASNEPLRNIAERWSVSKTELMRHRNQHLPVSAIVAQEAEEVTPGTDLLDEIRDLQVRIQAILERAEDAEELSVALQAIREAGDNVELLAELLEELDGGRHETD